MPKVRVSEATNLQLDWMVAKAEGLLGEITQAQTWVELSVLRGGVAFTHGRTYSPTTNWAQGGSILDDADINVISKKYLNDPAKRYMAYLDGGYVLDSVFGQTRLVAAMRCYVASKLGEEVEVPDGLV